MNVVGLLETAGDQTQIRTRRDITVTAVIIKMNILRLRSESRRSELEKTTGALSRRQKIRKLSWSWLRNLHRRETAVTAEIARMPVQLQLPQPQPQQAPSML